MKTDKQYYAKVDYYDLDIFYSLGFNAWMIRTYPITDIECFKSKSLQYLKRKVSQYFGQKINWN